MRYMRKGRRCKVHIGDFRAYIKEHYPKIDKAAKAKDEEFAALVKQAEEIQKKLQGLEKQGHLRMLFLHLNSLIFSYSCLYFIILLFIIFS